MNFTVTLIFTGYILDWIILDSEYNRWCSTAHHADFTWRSVASHSSHWLQRLLGSWPFTSNRYLRCTKDKKDFILNISKNIKRDIGMNHIEESHNFLKKWKTNLPEDTTVQRNVSIFILVTQIQTFSTASKTFNIIGYKWWNPQTTLNAYNKNVTHVLNMFKCWDLVKNNPRGLQMFHLPNKCCSLKSSQLQPWHNQDGGREIKSYPVWLISLYLCQTLSGGNVTIF